jgi:hypothetical protein
VYWTSTHAVTTVARGLVGWTVRGWRLVAAVLMFLAWIVSLSVPLYAQESLRVSSTTVTATLKIASPIKLKNVQSEG